VAGVLSIRTLEDDIKYSQSYLKQTSGKFVNLVFIIYICIINNSAIMDISTSFSTNLFWDIDSAGLDMEEHASFIIARVLDFGTMADWRFVKSYYGLDRLRHIALHIKSMERESLSFISTVTNTPENQFRCYKLLQSKNTHWYF